MKVPVSIAALIHLLLLFRAEAGPKAVDQIPGLAALPDATEALQKQIDDQDGNLVLGGTKILRITAPLEFDLARLGAASVSSDGRIILVMDGPGPALRFTGSHQGTASPESFQPATWNEHMPVVRGIEIVGNHPEADGIELVRTVGPVIDGVSIRWCRHGIHLVERNRNVVVSSCHLYENAGIGLYLDDVNLHQTNVSNSHISYNRGGGIVVRDGNVRNLQVTGCDIEANMPGDETATRAANILIDVSGSAGDASKSVAEVAITGCTIQHSANYSGSEDKTNAPGGANIRLAGKAVYPIDSVAITGNVLSDTTVNVEIDHAHDVTISSNTFFAPKPDNLRVTNSQRIVVSGNTFNPREFSRPGVIRFRDCADCIVANSALHQLDTASGALVLERCEGFVLTGLSFSDCGSGIVLRESGDTTISGCRITRTGESGTDLSIDGTNAGVLLNGNSFPGRTEVAPEALAPRNP